MTRPSCGHPFEIIDRGIHGKSASHACSMPESTPRAGAAENTDAADTGGLDEPEVEVRPGTADTDEIGRVLPGWGDEAGWEALRVRHREEISRRRNWCCNEKLFPTEENLWRAPGDDTQFMFGVSPWMPDSGEPNPAGVPYGVKESYHAKNKRKADGSAASAEGWSCHLCHKWVDFPPRPYAGDKEPHYWWWCFSCRKTASKPTKKELQYQRDVKGVKRMETFFGPKH